MNIDILGLFDQYGIKTGGEKETSEACVCSITCPFCNEKFHLGIFKEYGSYSCWKCKRTGSLFNLLHTLLGINWREYRELQSIPILTEKSLSEVLRDKLYGGVEVEETTYPSIVSKPQNALFSRDEKEKTRGKRLLKSFLKERRFKLKKLKKYLAYPCMSGKYVKRLVVPVYNVDGNFVGFQARDMTKRANEKYLNPSFPLKNHLYCAHLIKKNKVIIVEGVFDRWRIGKGSVASFGLGLSSEQLNVLIEKGVKHLVFAYDGEAFNVTKTIARKVSPLFETTKVLELPYGKDPDDIGRKKILELIKG
ncbi:MAG: hypothetical protein KJ556_21080 [Gammaproteobacteria bacterium]|nr:hypothetical protein [Gammaproteobacteria bacterium]